MKASRTSISGTTSRRTWSPKTRALIRNATFGVVIVVTVWLVHVLVEPSLKGDPADPNGSHLQKAADTWRRLRTNQLLETDQRDRESDWRMRCSAMESLTGKHVLVTGSAGFIGFHTAAALRGRGDGVVGFDNFNDYYPVVLKRERAAELGIVQRAKKRF